jgi:chemotaxis protein CheD
MTYQAPESRNRLKRSLRNRYRKSPLTVHAGDIVMGKGKRLLSTVLGSCVSLTLWHPGLHIGAMCHFALPTRPEYGINNECAGRYGDECLALLRLLCQRRGTSVAGYHCRLFGGSTVNDSEFSSAQSASSPTIGQRNVAVAFTWLQQEGATILEADVGESGFRRVWFDPQQGETICEFAPLSELT